MDNYQQQCDRSVGCLLGGAVGDALGAPVEFMDHAAIFKRFGKGGIQDFVTAYGRVGAFTDDTQMTLFTAEGCLRAFAAGYPPTSRDASMVMHRSYLRWLLTQSAMGDQQVDRTGWLMTHEGLFSRRAPGNTCLSALRRVGGERNTSKGCGGIMRVAPCGIFHAGDGDAAFEGGLLAAKLTHGHPTGYLAAGVFAAIIADLMVGKPLLEAVMEARTRLIRYPDHAETLSALENALARVAAEERPETALPALGEGWIAEEALAIAVYCALSAKNLEEGIVMAVNITGDSDSTGSMTGNLLGAMAGVTAIPRRWLDPLELRDVIETVARDLILLPAGVHDDESRAAAARYPAD